MQDRPARWIVPGGLWGRSALRNWASDNYRDATRVRSLFLVDEIASFG
jgi:hypothetical protein